MPITEAIRLKLDDFLAYSDRGQAYCALRNLEKAMSDYDEAIRLNPNYADAYLFRGDLYAQTGNRSKAEADYATSKWLKIGQ